MYFTIVSADFDVGNDGDGEDDDFSGHPSNYDQEWGSNISFGIM